MEDVFGEPPAADFSGSGAKNITTEEPKAESLDYGGDGHGLTHVGSSGEARMVDVSPKDISTRTAAASCKVMLGKKVFDLVYSNQIAKGDVLTVAKIAGISGAKHTSNLIPLCHNILLTHVDVELNLNSHDHSVEIKGVASCSGKTGVEMEAMMAASIAGLAVYDMCKAASKDIHISHVRLESKTGGKSGDWFRRVVDEGPVSTF
ncbi:hypothetical protein MLD38_005278 [Melastoma candidum]|nr:hypothetical protein MLD38_005278 [Melastoma candidum]